MSELLADNRIVEKVTIVVHTLGAWPNSTMSDNHWSIFLGLADEQSVRLNMTADPGDPTGRLKCQALQYAMTFSMIRCWDYQSAPGVSVAHIYQLVVGNGRDKYEMSGGGSGCRYWV